MGNIADALEKAGVELIDLSGQNAHAVKEHVDIGINEPFDKEPEPQRGKKAPDVLQSDTLALWDERIDLVANRSAHASEAFRVLRSRILFPQDGETRPKTIMVASSEREEGKSFVSVNLAVAIARGLDQYSLLVDCDLRRPSLAGLLGVQSTDNRGLTEYLQGECELPELICRTSVDKLSLLTAGSVPQNPAELLTSGRMSRLVNELSGRYSDRLIIFDSPPLQVASETMVLTKKVDGIVLVVGYGKSDRSKIKEMIDAIGKEKIIGVVFNGQRESYIQSKMFDRYGGYGKYYVSPE